MKFNEFNAFVSTLVFSGTITLFSMTSAQAAECKALTQDNCAASAGCAWIDSYKTKAGKTVNGYCRNKSTNKQGMEKDKPKVEATAGGKKAE
jgi:hypothetical protein